jgi:hypothetical protein
MDKYIVIAPINENYFLIGTESGEVLMATKEFIKDGIQYASQDLRLIEIESGAEKIGWDVDADGRSTEYKSVILKKFVLPSLGISFHGAFIPDIKSWVYVKGSIKTFSP